MLIHEFVALPKECVSLSISYNTIHKANFVAIPDEVVLANATAFFTGFSACWDTIDSFNEGLNYHGITIILPNELPHFLRNLDQLKTENGINDLLLLCNSAVLSNKCIVHFGI